jgi:molecular chaperone HtpG
MWYASTNFYGTIIDTTIKGLRIRQGNLLIGDNTTCAQFFKEERFNGWVIGEVHVLHDGLIANSRRDNFEQNEPYFQLAEEIQECAATITKELRKLSYDRSLSSAKKAVVEAAIADDVNGLAIEDMNFACDSDEFTLMHKSDGDLEAEADFVDKLSMILGQKSRQTKYTAININDKLTVEQRRVLERVFDVICQEYGEAESQAFINTIAGKF